MSELQDEAGDGMKGLGVQTFSATRVDHDPGHVTQPLHTAREGIPCTATEHGIWFMVRSQSLLTG